MSDPRHGKTLLSLKNKILLYILLPVLAIFIVAGAVMTGSVREMITEISGNEIFGSTRLSVSRIDSLLDDYTTLALSKANVTNVKHFLQTADNRDEMEDNAYFSYAIGELDSTISLSSYKINHVWLASAISSGVAFSNTSAGWTANEDFDIRECFFYDDLLSSSEGVIITDPYISPVTNSLVFTAAALVKESRTNTVLGVYAICFDTNSFAERIGDMPGDSNEIIIAASNDIIVYSTDSSLIESDFDRLDFSEQETQGTADDFFLSGRHMIGCSYVPPRSSWRIYSMRDYSETEALKLYYVRLTVLLFISMALVVFLAVSVGSGRIARPIQNYTRMINELDIERDDEFTEDELLSPEGCSELEDLAVGFNCLAKRNHEILQQLKLMNIRSEKQRILYQTALASSADVVFEYDIEADELISYGSAIDPSVPKTVTEELPNFLSGISSGGRFGTDDIGEAENFLHGKTEKELVLRYTDENSSHWLCFEGTAVLSEGEPVKVVGKIRCIDDMVRIREEAQKDTASGFFNKAATEKLIAQSLLSVTDSAAVILVDVDNFKSVNDTFGHDYGDYVIKDVSDKIRSCLDDSAIPGRIGGDEFMLFIPHADHCAVSELCRTLCDKIRFTYTSESSEGEIRVSASIGAALFPEHGTGFEELYRSADIAMYISKISGKDRATVYDGQERAGYHSDRK